MSEESKGEDNEINAAIRAYCARSFGVLDSAFLCQSIGVLNPRQPICVAPDEKLRNVIKGLQDQRVGCVLITNPDGTLGGIFSERDVLLKVIDKIADLDSVPVSAVMTPHPTAERADATTAYALNLMSLGGFRHLPIVDEHNHPVGIISVKDIVDYIVRTLTDDLLKFETQS